MYIKLDRLFCDVLVEFYLLVYICEILYRIWLYIYIYVYLVCFLFDLVDFDREKFSVLGILILVGSDYIEDKLEKS